MLRVLRSALLGHAHGLASATCGAGALATHTQTPPMSQTTMSADFLETFEVLAQLAVQPVGHHLSRGAFMHILSAVEEPCGNAVALRVLDDAHDLFNLRVVEFSCTLAQIDSSSLQHQTTEAQSAALDGAQCEHHLASPVDVGVENTQDKPEVLWLGDDEGALCSRYHPAQEINMAIRFPCQKRPKSVSPSSPDLNHLMRSAPIYTIQTDAQPGASPSL